MQTPRERPHPAGSIRGRRAFLVSLAAALAGCERRKPVLVYVNSYHKGYGSSDEIRAGIESALATADLQLDVLYLDGKRNPGNLPKTAREVFEHIRRRKPDVILVSDDDAMAHLVAPYLRDGPTPVLFCGVNWTADQYGVPNQHVTGMLEMLPVEETIQLVKQQRPEGNRLFVLSEDSPAERKNQEYFRPIFWKTGLSATYGLVPDFEHWKKAFRWANRNADLIFFVTNGGIQGWNDKEALAHIRETLAVPVFTCDAFMLRYAVVGRVKIAAEQGEWVATHALEILQGASPPEIPLARNQQSRILGNPELAALINFPLPPEASQPVASNPG